MFFFFDFLKQKIETSFAKKKRTKKTVLHRSIGKPNFNKIIKTYSLGLKSVKKSVRLTAVDFYFLIKRNREEEFWSIGLCGGCVSVRVVCCMYFSVRLIEKAST